MAARYVQVIKSADSARAGSLYLILLPKGSFELEMDRCGVLPALCKSTLPAINSVTSNSQNRRLDLRPDRCSIFLWKSSNQLFLHCLVFEQKYIAIQKKILLFSSGTMFIYYIIHEFVSPWY